MADIAIAQPARRPGATDAVAQSSRRLHSGKLVAAAFSLAVLGAMLSPVVKNWQERPRDSFPLSYFPMFSYGLSDLQTEHYLAGWDAQGNRYAIHHSYVAPGGSVVRIRRETVQAMVKRGQAAALCRSVSQRIAEKNPRSLRSLVRLQVVTGRFSLAEYLHGNKAPISENVRATCAIKG
jgi:hypothetical protein